ncbi:MAG: hypothetical protein QME81_05280 [bacterium]|nr:hypothetical protein [bacterium]
MSFDWTEYIRLSEELIQKEEEVYLRSAISRSYYGVFCIARNKLGYQRYSGRDVHGKIIDGYKNSADRIQEKIGKNLDELRKARNSADYDGDRKIDKPMAKKMLILAKQALNNLGIPL